MKVLVTGGAGFIGTSVITRLLDQGSSVVNLDKITYAASRNDSFGKYAAERQYVLEVGDTADRASIGRIFAQYRPDAVLHLAGGSHVDRSIDDPGDFVLSNLTGTVTLLEAARSYWRELPPDERAQFRFHHVSTAEVYGSLERGESADEGFPYRPSSPYAASKAGADLILQSWYKTFGLPVLISRSSNNYGPRQFPEKLVPRMIVNALRGESLPIYGTGTNQHDWLFVEDHAEAICRILTHGRPGESFNIGGDAVYSNLDLVRMICAILDELQPQSPHQPHARLINFVADRPGHDRRYAIDNSKIRSELEWQPRETLASGLRKTVQWYIQNRAWWERL